MPVLTGIGLETLFVRDAKRFVPYMGQPFLERAGKPRYVVFATDKHNQETLGKNTIGLSAVFMMLVNTCFGHFQKVTHLEKWGAEKTDR